MTASRGQVTLVVCMMAWRVFVEADTFLFDLLFRVSTPVCVCLLPLFGYCGCGPRRKGTPTPANGSPEVLTVFVSRRAQNLVFGDEAPPRAGVALFWVVWQAGEVFSPCLFSVSPVYDAGSTEAR